MIDNSKIDSITALLPLPNKFVEVLTEDLSQCLGTLIREETQARLMFYTGLPDAKIRPLFYDGVLPTPKTLDTIAQRLGLTLVIEAVPENVTSGIERFSVPSSNSSEFGISLQMLINEVVSKRANQKRSFSPDCKRRMERALAGKTLTVKAAQSILRHYGMQLQVRMI